MSKPISTSTQSATAVLMVRPSSFGYDIQTAKTNAFQHRSSSDEATVRGLAEHEFDEFVSTLREHDIEVAVHEGATTPPQPNAVFPNNWLTTWPDGRVYLYPMATVSRRYERSPVALDLLAKTFKVSSVHDLSGAETRNQFLESTGVMVFDHPARTVYACLSPRCDEVLFVEHARQLGYIPVAFKAFAEEMPVYHTNVMLGIHSSTAVICSELIPDADSRRKVLSSLRASGHRVVNITAEQVLAFCGNTLEVQNRRGERFLVMSASAHAAFTATQLKILAHDKTILPVAIPTIEQIGGGSARCMLAEIFLPRI